MKYNAAKNPIAIVGMAFRFPGDLSDEQSFWQALKEGRDLVTCIGSERWPTDLLQHSTRSEPGRSVTFSAGILSRIEDFDAGFFGISPREAAFLDPQQRLLLVLAWEAMENGGFVPSSLAGSDCSVHVGISGVDYGLRALDDLSSMAAHSMTGNTMSIAANRLSNFFDLRGSSVAVDTACSSSLVALHLACNSLCSGESSLAMVAGVNLLLHPYAFIGFTKASMLSAKGRCSAFDASGDGYVRAEGATVLLLKPLDKALADGDNIQAVILASGVNSDGGRKTGLTIPSNEGQAELMRSVLQRSGLSAGDIDYIEAHGTGTPVGDPIEAKAIGEVYGSAHGQPLPIGSVKTNLGHLESASGMAGLVKSILALKNRAIPASLHLVTPNPHIDFSGLNIEVVTSYRPLPESGHKKLVVGVNSFGFGGVNAHVLLQEFSPEKHATQQTETALPPIFLSARTPQALRDLAGEYAGLLQQYPESYYDIAYGAALRRERLNNRLAIVAGDAMEVADGLFAFAQGETSALVAIEDALVKPGGVAFIYSGNGVQWLGMGRKLLASAPRFAELMAGMDASVRTLAGFSIIDELQADAATSRLNETFVAQPLLFAMQVALTTLLRERGVEAQAVMGHSVGEVAAAWASGALRLDQAIEVICARSAAQELTRGSGRMAVVGLAEDAARELIETEKLIAVEVASINSPSNVTLSGDLDELMLLQNMLVPRGVFFRLLDLDFAFHSRYMDPIKDGLLTSLSSLAPSSVSEINYVSTVTGEVLDGALLNAHYWVRNIREPVRFSQAMSTLSAQGCRVFVEIGPHAILQRYINECLSAGEIVGRVLPTLLRDNDGPERLEEAALRIHLLTEAPRIGIFFPEPGCHVRLPNYPWQRERHWQPRTSEDSGLFSRHRVHPLLGWRLKDTPASWENVLDVVTCPWLVDHKVANGVVLPGAAYAEMALAAARDQFGGTRFELEELDIVAPVVFDGEHARSIRFELSVRDGGFEIRSRLRLSEDEWMLNAVGRLLEEPSAAVPISTIRNMQGGEAIIIDHDTHYQLTGELGLDYGASFRGLDRAEVLGKTLSATLALGVEVAEASAQYLIHPALLDVCFQSLVGFFKEEIMAGQGTPLLPVKIGRMIYYADTPVVRFSVCLKHRSTRSVLADFELQDADGNIVAALADCRFRAAVIQRRTHADPMCWKIVPHLKPLASEQYQVKLPHSQIFIRQLRTWFENEKIELGRDAHFKSELPLFEALTVAFVRDAFQELFALSGEWMQGALNMPENVDEAVRPFFLWLVRILQQEKLLVKRPTGTWELDPSDIPAAQSIWQSLLRQYPASMPELVLAATVGRSLTALLRGDADSSALAERLRRNHQTEMLYDDSHTYLGTRIAVQKILHIVASEWPSHRRLRVLEIVAGTSGVVRNLIETFPEERLDYVIASADEEACDRLKTEYAGHSSVSIAKLENEEGCELFASNALPESFDVVIFRHCLHRMPNPVIALAFSRLKLASGGLLIIAERHDDYFADFVSGLAPCWWRGNIGDELASPLMSPKVWEHALDVQGFDDIGTFCEQSSEELVEGAYLILSKRPEEDVIAVAEPTSATWLLACDNKGSSRELAERQRRLLESQGQRVMLASTRGNVKEDGIPLFIPNDPALIVQLLEMAHNTMGKVDHFVYMVGLGNEAAMLNEVPMLPENDRVVGALHLVQAIAQTTLQPRLWLVMAGGALADVDFDGFLGDPLQGALWGFGRVVMNEYPALDCTLIDIDISLSDAEAATRLQAEFLQPDGEKEILLAAQGRFTLRMQRTSPMASKGDDAAVSRFRLDFRVPGHLRNLVWLPLPHRSLADEEVEVRVMTTGLNFRDVMYLMGLLPDEAVENGFAGASLGLEFAGVVTGVGKRVEAFEIGDAVMGFGSACFGSHVITKANAVTHKPSEWSFEEAATVPTVFFTVYYALKYLADLQPGERVLIHGAAGGVGIAAVQLALYLGAEVFATAGSEDKRDFVKLLGADHVLDSRSLAFANEILALTDGEGVDVVLNSLAGEAVRRNLGILKPFGRFLELGKRDFFENTRIGLRPFKDNITYFGIDADQLLIARPKLAARLFREVMGLFRDEILSPLPFRVFPANRVVDAFRTMQQARQIGKVVVKFDGVRIPVETAKTLAVSQRIAKEATWIITGGLSGFGLESARWLAALGVQCLVLVGRRGKATPGAEDAVSELAALGVRAEIIACDITDRAAVQLMLDDVRRNCPPVSGILHAAMEIDDVMIANLDASRLRKVLAPKLLGAWHLHNLTQDFPLEHFVLYSSVTTFIGNPGQANYVAANASLESLTALRRSMGLPATCIGWGPIGDAGYLTRNQAIKDSLRSRLGAAPLNAHDALALLAPLLSRDSGTTAVADFDWAALARLLPSSDDPRFEFMRKHAGPAMDEHISSSDICSLIAGKTPEEAQAIVQSLVTQEVAQILCLSADRIAPATSLLDMGMDSLMGVELALGLEERFGVRLPVMMLNEGPTVERVSLRIVERILSADDQTGGVNEYDLKAVTAILALQHGEAISDEDLAQDAEQVGNMNRANVKMTI